MGSFFYNITKAFKNLAVAEPAPQNNEPKANVNPNFPDFSTSEYASLGRDFRFFPEVHNPFRPNFIPRPNSKPSHASGRVPGRYYPSGTSEQLYTEGEHKHLEKVGSLQRQMTVGRWRAICNNEECLEDCGEGYWEKVCEIDVDTNQITCATKFMGRCNRCGRIFHEHAPGVLTSFLHGRSRNESIDNVPYSLTSANPSRSSVTASTLTTQACGCLPLISHAEE